MPHGASKVECVDCQEAKTRAYSAEGMAQDEAYIKQLGCTDLYKALDTCLKTKDGSICE